MCVELNGDVRKEVMDILNEEDVCCEGTYVQSSGPRFETKSEIRFFQKMGVCWFVYGKSEPCGRISLE